MLDSEESIQDRLNEVFELAQDSSDAPFPPIARWT
jgi:hypothetical protein